MAVHRVESAWAIESSDQVSAWGPVVDCEAAVPGGRASSEINSLAIGEDSVTEGVVAMAGSTCQR